MRLLFAFITLSSCCIFSCKKNDLRKSFADGVVTDAESLEPIPYAKVYLMMTNSIFFTTGSGEFYRVDSIIIDKNGVFHFDFEVSDEVERVGFYLQKEHYFDYEKVIHYGLSEMESGVKPPLYPKSYLKIRVKDEPPFSDYTGLHIPVISFQPSIWLEGNPLDTTVYLWLHGQESTLIDWYYHNPDSTWVQDFGGWVGCPSFDTCSYEILF
jgi:hypothetical protein